MWQVNSVSLEPTLHTWAALTESNHRERIRLWHQLVGYIVERVPVASIGICFQGSWRICTRDRSTVCLSGGETQGPVSGGVCHTPWAQICSSLPAWAKFYLQEKFSLLYPSGKICRKTIIPKKTERCSLIFYLFILFLQVSNRISTVLYTWGLEEVTECSSKNRNAETSSVLPGKKEHVT